MSGATVGSSDDDGCECIVCMEDVRARGQGHIYQCPEGHVFCATCWQQLGGPTAPCPTCKTPLATIRNRMAEKQRDQLLKMKIKLSCAAAGEGGDGEEEGVAGGRNQASGAPSRATTAAKRRARKAKAIAAGKDRDAWEVSLPVPSVHACARRQHLQRGLMGRCCVVQCGAPWRPAGSGAVLADGPDGALVSAEHVDTAGLDSCGPSVPCSDAGGPQGNAAAAPAAELRGTARGGSLIPSSFVSFCEDPTHKGGFTPVYEPADGCSYSAHASMSSVNAGAFELYVGGAAINRSFLAPFHSETAAGSASSRPFFCPPPFCPPCAAFLS